MTKEQIEERIKSTEAEMQQVVANYNVLTGQLNEAKHWLSQIVTEVVTEIKNYPGESSAPE